MTPAPAPDHPVFDPRACSTEHLLMRVLPIDGPPCTLEQAAAEIRRLHPEVDARFTVTADVRLSWHALERQGWARWAARHADTRAPGGYRLTDLGERRLRTLWQQEVVEPTLRRIEAERGLDAAHEAARKWAEHLPPEGSP